MSSGMSLEHAKTIATGYGAGTVNEIRAANTIVKVGELRSTLNTLIRIYEDGAVTVQIETPEGMAKSTVNKLNEILGDTDD